MSLYTCPAVQPARRSAMAPLCRVSCWVQLGLPFCSANSSSLRCLGRGRVNVPRTRRNVHSQGQRSGVLKAGKDLRGIAGKQAEATVQVDGSPRRLRSCWRHSGCLQGPRSPSVAPKCSANCVRPKHSAGSPSCFSSFQSFRVFLSLTNLAWHWRFWKYRRRCGTGERGRGGGQARRPL